MRDMEYMIDEYCIDTNVENNHLISLRFFSVWVHVTSPASKIFLMNYK